MYGDFFLVESDGQARTAPKVPVGDTRGRSEAWLRDTLFAHPEILPIADIDSAFGPLIPLCRELRTEAGPLDLAFINPAGRLTLVECKLWRNPESRRKVVAQVLDYARAISRWSYSDLQRQVSSAVGEQGNIPFRAAQRLAPYLSESEFVDATTRTMRMGRFLLLIAGDGIREDIGALSELINRNAALGFSFGLVEVALYDLAEHGGGVAVQPRVVAKTQVIERPVVLLQGGREDQFLGASDEGGSLGNVRNGNGIVEQRPASDGSRHDAYRQWWQPVLDMQFDDPDQEPLKLYYPNNVRTQLPWPGTWVTAYRANDRCGVFVGGREEPLREIWSALEPDLGEVLSEVPGAASSSGSPVSVSRPMSGFRDDEAARDWLKRMLNAYVNALRPRLKVLVSKG